MVGARGVQLPVENEVPGYLFPKDGVNGSRNGFRQSLCHESAAHQPFRVSIPRPVDGEDYFLSAFGANVSRLCTEHTIFSDNEVGGRLSDRGEPSLVPPLDAEMRDVSFESSSSGPFLREADISPLACENNQSWERSHSGLLPLSLLLSIITKAVGHLAFVAVVLMCSQIVVK